MIDFTIPYDVVDVVKDCEICTLRPLSNETEEVGKQTFLKEFFVLAQNGIVRFSYNPNYNRYYDLVKVKKENKVAAATSEEIRKQFLEALNKDNSKNYQEVLNNITSLSLDIQMKEQKKLEAFVSQIPKLTLPCGHVFHLSCLCNLPDLTQCPLCLKIEENVKNMLTDEGLNPEKMLIQNKLGDGITIKIMPGKELVDSTSSIIPGQGRKIKDTCDIINK